MVHLDIIYLVISICKYGIPSYNKIQTILCKNYYLTYESKNDIFGERNIPSNVLCISAISIETCTSDLYESSLAIYMLSCICKTSITKPSFDIKINISG